MKYTTDALMMGKLPVVLQNTETGWQGTYYVDLNCIVHAAGGIVAVICLATMFDGEKAGVVGTMQTSAGLNLDRLRSDPATEVTLSNNETRPITEAPRTFHRRGGAE